VRGPMNTGRLRSGGGALGSLGWKGVTPGILAENGFGVSPHDQSDGQGYGHGVYAYLVTLASSTITANL
jgi:hypothetical protein